jgi:hypothetical protein
MNNKDDEINRLTNRVISLELRLEELVADYRKCVRALGGYDELLNKHCKLLDEEVADDFARIKNIELKFFPHLAKDIDRLGRIIGDPEEKPENPLDRRKP